MSPGVFMERWEVERLISVPDLRVGDRYNFHLPDEGRILVIQDSPHKQWWEMVSKHQDSTGESVWRREIWMREWPLRPDPLREAVKTAQATAQLAWEEYGITP